MVSKGVYKMRDTFKGLAILVKAHCKECNGNNKFALQTDCQGNSCPLYPYFKSKLLTSNKKFEGEETKTVSKRKSLWDSLTPEQRIEWTKKMQAGRRLKAK